MRKFHPKNERIKHQYASYITEAKRLSDKSADIALAAIADFESSTKHKDFTAFHIEQAKRYKRILYETVSSRTTKTITKTTMKARLNAVKAFFIWLADKPGYKSRISYSDCEYFNLPANDTRIANASRPVRFPDLKQIEWVLSVMPDRTDVEKRDKALVALAIATGMRVDALASLKIRYVDAEAKSVFQDARDVRTKFRKTMRTTFFPVGDDIFNTIETWIRHLKETLLYSRDDPVFPKTKVEAVKGVGFQVMGLTREHWNGSGAIRIIFKKAFENAGLPYFHPHSFKHTLGQLGEQICRSPEEYKAWSQNLAHENVLTTFTSYGKVREDRQVEILNALDRTNDSSSRKVGAPDQETINWVLDHLKR